MTERVLARRLTSLDAAFLHLERPEAPLHIGGLSVLAGDVPAAAYVQRLEARLPEVPRYMQRVAPAPFGLGHPVWEAAPDFDLRRHVIEAWVEPPGDERQLQACASRLFAGCLDRSRPLWELYALRGLSGGRSALLSKIHHCMVDGISGVELMNILFDPSPDAAAGGSAAAVRTMPETSGTGLVLEAIWEAASQGLEAGKTVARGLASLPAEWRGVVQRAVDTTAALVGAAQQPVARLPFNRPLTGPRRLAWLTLPLDEARAIARCRGGTVNDVVLAVLTDGIGRFLAEGGYATEGRALRLLVPVNVRRADEHGLLGNRVSMIPVEVPFAGAPLDRLEQTVVRTVAMKRAGVADLVELAAAAGGLVPAALYGRALSLATSATLLTWTAPLRTASFLTANLVCTNVPGPPVPLFGLGYRVVAHYPLVPLGFETGVNCAVFTYDGIVHLGLVADAGAIDDLAPLMREIRRAYDDLRTAAGPIPADTGTPLARATPRARQRGHLDATTPAVTSRSTEEHSCKPAARAAGRARRERPPRGRRRKGR